MEAHPRIASLLSPYRAMSHIISCHVGQKPTSGRRRALPLCYSRFEQTVLLRSSPHQLPVTDQATCTCDAGGLCISNRNHKETPNGPEEVHVSSHDV
jgi:hypothetical protein